MNYLTAFLVGPESGTKIRGACPIGTDKTDETPFTHSESEGLKICETRPIGTDKTDKTPFTHPEGCSESETKIRGACPIGTDETDKTPFMHPENPPKDMIAWRFVSFVSADLARSQDFRGVIERLKGQADNDGVLRDDPTDLFNQLTDKPPRPPRKSRWRT